MKSRPRGDPAQSVLEFVAGIAAPRVKPEGRRGEDVPQPGEAPDDLAQHQRCSVSVLDVGGVDHGVDQIARGVGEDVALAAPDLLARVIATRFAGFPMTGRLALQLHF